MKQSILAIFLISSVLVACGGAESVSEEYLKTHKSADVKPKEKEKEKKEPETKGDAAKGDKLLETCNSCHATGMTKLNKDAVAKLDTAYTGANSANHKALKDSFEKPGRLDLEAALETIK